MVTCGISLQCVDLNCNIPSYNTPGVPSQFMVKVDKHSTYFGNNKTYKNSTVCIAAVLYAFVPQIYLQIYMKQNI